MATHGSGLGSVRGNLAVQTRLAGTSAKTNSVVARKMANLKHGGNIN
jgi:hypothetical protein